MLGSAAELSCEKCLLEVETRMAAQVSSFTQRGTRVYVGGLNENIKKEDLELKFEKYGKLNHVWVAFNPPGFAFVEFANIDDAENACEGLNGTEVMGSTLRVEISRARGRRMLGDGGRGFRGRYNRGATRNRYMLDRGDFSRGGYDDRRGRYEEYGSSRGRRSGYRGSRDYRRSSSRDRYGSNGYNNGRGSASYRSHSPADVNSSRDNRSSEGSYGFYQADGGY